MQSDDCNPHLQPFPACFTQWVTVNVNHNVVTLDGLGTFHGMGNIALSTRECNSSSVVHEQAVRRLKRMRVTEIVKHKGIPIKFYQGNTNQVLLSS